MRKQENKNLISKNKNESKVTVIILKYFYCFNNHCLLLSFITFSAFVNENCSHIYIKVISKAKSKAIILLFQYDSKLNEFLKIWTIHVSQSKHKDNIIQYSI